MSSTSSLGPLAKWYESRIGPVTNDNEVGGYWLFMAGVLAGIIGLVVFFVTEDATQARGVGYAIAALAPVLIVLGAALRLPLRKMATIIVGIGALISIAAVVWFLLIFPEGWSLTVGDTGVIVTYVAGLAVMGLGASFIPLVTDPRDVALEAGAAREQELLAAIENLELDAEELATSKATFQLYKDQGDEWRWRLRHDNGNIIADSGEGYTAKANAQKGIRSLKRNVFGAEVESE